MRNAKQLQSKEKVTCPSCKGDGIYKHHTSCTRDGKPFCFRCNGDGYLLLSPRKSQELAESTGYPFSKLFKTSDNKLVSYVKRFRYTGNDLSREEVPF